VLAGALAMFWSMSPLRAEATAPAAAVPAPAQSLASFTDPVIPFDFSVSGLLQFQYEAVIRQGQPAPAESGVDLRRARFAVDTKIMSPRLSLRAELSADQGTLAPLDLYAEGRPSRSIAIRVGQMRVPFSASWLVPDQALIFPERSVATDAFRYDYDLGLLLILRPRRLDGRLVVMAGAFNGAGKNVAANDNVDPALLLRVAGTPLGLPPDAGEADLAVTTPPSLTIGGSAILDYVPVPDAYGYVSGFPLSPRPITVRDADMNRRPDGVRVVQLEVDVDVRWRGFAAQGEAYLRNETWFETGEVQPVGSRFTPKRRFRGGYGQISYRLPWLPLVPSARWAVAEVSPLLLDGRRLPPQTCVAPDGAAFSCALPYSDRRAELSLAVAYLPRGLHLAFTTIYSRLVWSSTLGDPLPSARDQRATMQAQVWF
jgi:hypothetical protein